MSNYVEIWEAISGAVLVLLGAAFAWGKHQEKLNAHDKIISGCRIDKLMTEEKCRTMHDSRQSTIDMQLRNIIEMQREMRESLVLYQTQLSAAVGRIEHLAGRIERS